MSPSRRSIQASLYFVVWTQIGSFIVLCVLVYIIVVTGSSEFRSLKHYTFTGLEGLLVYTALFLGFGIKVPI